MRKKESSCKGEAESMVWRKGALNAWENSDQLYTKVNVFLVLPKVMSVLFPKAL